MTLKQKAFLVGILNPDTWTTVCRKCIPLEPLNKRDEFIRTYIIIQLNKNDIAFQPITQCTVCGSHKYVYNLKSKTN